MTQYLILLALFPIATLNLTKMFFSNRRWLLIGLVTGLVIAPVCMGLTAFTYVPIIGKVLGGAGIVGNLIHGSVGYFFLVVFGGMESGVLLTASQLITINIVNAGIWGSYYGLVGHHIDKKLAEEGVTVPHKIRQTSRIKV